MQVHTNNLRQNLPIYCVSSFHHLYFQQLSLDFILLWCIMAYLCHREWLLLYSSPTPDQRRDVCRAIIAKYPFLSDASGGYVSLLFIIVYSLFLLFIMFV